MGSRQRQKTRVSDPNPLVLCKGLVRWWKANGQSRMKASFGNVIVQFVPSSGIAYASDESSGCFMWLSSLSLLDFYFLFCFRVYFICFCVFVCLFFLSVKTLRWNLVS